MSTRTERLHHTLPSEITSPVNTLDFTGQVGKDGVKSTLVTLGTTNGIPSAVAAVAPIPAGLVSAGFDFMSFVMAPYHTLRKIGEIREESKEPKPQKPGFGRRFAWAAENIIDNEVEMWKDVDSWAVAEKTRLKAVIERDLREESLARASRVTWPLMIAVLRGGWEVVSNGLHAGDGLQGLGQVKDAVLQNGVPTFLQAAEQFKMNPDWRGVGIVAGLVVLSFATSWLNVRAHWAATETAIKRYNSIDSQRDKYKRIYGDDRLNRAEQASVAVGRLFGDVMRKLRQRR